MPRGPSSDRDGLPRLLQPDEDRRASISLCFSGELGGALIHLDCLDRARIDGAQRSDAAHPEAINEKNREEVRMILIQIRRRAGGWQSGCTALRPDEPLRALLRDLQSRNVLEQLICLDSRLGFDLFASEECS